MLRATVLTIACSTLVTALSVAPALAAGHGASAVENCTGTAPVVCHFDVPPGTYDVTAVLGGAQAGSTVVTAEARRVMLAATATGAGEQVRESFTVNVRDPEGQPTRPGGSPGLDLYFGGQVPRLSDLTVTPSDHAQLFLAGDSTVCDQETAPYTGWGQMLPQFFTQGLSVANHADSGESAGSFLANSRLFPAMRPLIGDGDVVLIQFGHNDKQTTAQSFRTSLNGLIDGVRARGGTPVLVTPIVRRWFNTDGTLNNGTALHVNALGVNLPAEMRRLAAERGVALIDLTQLTRQRVEELGPQASRALYLTNEAGDNTHTSERGATEFSHLVLRQLAAQNLIPAELIR
ncbi:rhamnogalacturonan acetylesterase [Streptomyces sp. 8K308]|nr:rhamnogalacturonan acetylesterase [Streptomyces sp. 8K308]